MARLHGTVSGRVQTVGYRAFVRASAAELGVEARATNESDGTVLVEASGERDALETLVLRLHEGPPHAHVESVQVVWS
jgi:acylphosphatase